MKKIILAILVLAFVSTFSQAIAGEKEYEITIEIVWNSVDSEKMYELLADTLKIHKNACKLDYKIKMNDSPFYTLGNIVWHDYVDGSVTVRNGSINGLVVGSE